MDRVSWRLLVVCSMPLLALWAGCNAPAVGDPCEPENVPVGGFNANEAYLETSSVQCRTRVCMVYKLGGDPREGCTTDCADPTLSEQKVYCTCRCDRPADGIGKTCSCPGGYICVPVLDLGGPGVRGSYCCREDDPDCQMAAMEAS